MDDSRAYFRGQELSGLRKAAVFLLSLDQELAATVLSGLEKDEIETLSLEIARIRNIEKSERDVVLEEFYHLELAQKYVAQGGLAYAKALLEKSLSPNDAAKVLETLEHSIRSVPFNFLRKAEAENLLTFIQDEHPQTIALILSHLTPAKGSEILKGLPAEKQVEVIKRIATMEHTSPEVINQVERALEKRLAAIVTQEFQEAGGIESVAEMLNVTDRSTEKTILENLEEEDAELVEQIKKLMFVFEDILKVNDRGIQALLKEVDNEELALSLKTASPELREKIFRNMSDRATELIKEEMDYMGPVRLSDVEAAQQTIVDVVRRLEETGDVIIHGRGEGEVIV
jgi:flagellar motor switch protein FliG